VRSGPAGRSADQRKAAVSPERNASEDEVETPPQSQRQKSPARAASKTPPRQRPAKSPARGVSKTPPAQSKIQRLPARARSKTPPPDQRKAAVSPERNASEDEVETPPQSQRVEDAAQQDGQGDAAEGARENATRSQQDGQGDAAEGARENATRSQQDGQGDAAEGARENATRLGTFRPVRLWACRQEAGKDSRAEPP
jgi:hypothetical protein